ncbi:MAG: regulatory iron-sulfur-containing complex subunit RicT [Candidatus Moranbacteria bacterium]|nr:regulatory iron-sulfur-containing complex subunit RicT [Candidatus Moranbacteria bacterium]
MTRTIFLKIRRWENSQPIESAQSFQKGDLLIVETNDGLESAIVEDVRENSGKKLPGLQREAPVAKIVRKASLRDINTIKEHREKEKEALELCRKEVKKNEMPMKIVEASYSFDGGNISFAFVADGRVDFRELVKTLSKVFQRSIRLHQIGARDEARESGGYGICGRGLCCERFKENLPSINSEMAKAQQIVRRGSERISGLCGRLMCCLAYEANQYREILEELPKIGEEIKTKEGKGIVKEVNALSGEIKVELENKKYIRIASGDI